MLSYGEAATTDIAGNVYHAYGMTKIGTLMGPQDDGSLGVFRQQSRNGRTQALLADGILAKEQPSLFVDGDLVDIGFLLRGRTCLWQGNLDALLLAKGRGDHEKDEEKKHHIDERSDIDSRSPPRPS